MYQLLSAVIIGVHMYKLSLWIKINCVCRVECTCIFGLVERQPVIVVTKRTVPLRSIGMSNIVQSVNAVSFIRQHLFCFILERSPVDSFPFIVYLCLFSGHFHRGTEPFVR